MMDQRKLIWLDSCHECTKQNPLQKNKRCLLWHAIVTKSPMADEMMDKVKNVVGTCSMFEMKDER